MKRNIFKSIVLLCILSACSALNMCFSHPRNPVLADNIVTARAEYYDLNGVNNVYLENIKNKSGLDLQNGLSIMMSATQSSITSYEELKNSTILTDADPMNSNNIITLYSRDSISGVWNSSLWNREHVWCKSLSNGLYTTMKENERNAGSDIHHLRPAYVTYNSSRQDRPYGEVNMSEAEELGNTGNYKMKGMFEPRDDIKGDIARILMYVYVRYSSSLSSTNNELGARGNLRITDIVKTETNTSSAAWDLLLKWNELDPVDYLEMQRNDEAQKLQGNRNVFIDHPEFAKMCFGSYQGQGALVDLENTYDENRASYLGINVRNTTLVVGSNINLITKTFPERAAVPIVKWKSNNNDVVTIDTTGKAVAVNEGNAIIEAYTATGLKAKCNIEVVNSKLIYKYDGNALSTTNQYSPNISSQFTYNDITMEVKASYGSANNGDLWLGTNANKADQSKILKDDPIGVALKFTADKKGAVLYFNGELENVGKITFQQSDGQGGTYIYVLYSLDNGATYQQIGNRKNLGSSKDLEVFNFDTIEKARYALAFTTADDAKAMVQSKKPCVTFFSEEVTYDELVVDLLNNFDSTDFENSIYQATLIIRANELYKTLNETEKGKVTNASMLTSLTQDEIKGYEFIYYQWTKTYNDLTKEDVDEIIGAYNNLSTESKALISRMKSNTIESEDVITIEDALSYIQSDDFVPPEEPDPTPEEPELDPIPETPNKLLFIGIGLFVGIIIIVGSVILILRKNKH